MVARVNVRSWKSVSGMSGSDTLSSVTTKSTAASTAPPTIHAVVALAHFIVPAVSPNLIESKSLKLYLASFRNHGAFHEDCTVAIGRKLADLLQPKWLRIGGYWYPRGGMPIDVFWQSGAAPDGLWLPDQGVPSYRGRG